MNLEPLQDTVLVKPLAEDHEEAGLFIPSLVEEENEKVTLRCRRGEVVASRSAFSLHPGDVVYFIDGTYRKNKQRVNRDEFEFEGQILIHVKDEELRGFLKNTQKDQ